MKHALLLALASAALIACATPATSTAQQSGEPAVPTGAKDTCGAAQYASFVGKPIGTPGVPAPSREVRHIWPNSVVTMDFAESRLNFKISAEGTITALACY